MNKKKTIIVFFIVVLSVALIILTSIYFLDNTGKINQGNFRINDAILESYVKIEEKQDESENLTELSNIVMNISQTNMLSLLIADNSNISEIYIDKISTSSPLKMGELYITQENSQKKIDCFDKEGRYNLTASEKDGQKLVEIEIVNKNCLQDVNVPNETKLITYDGTILELLNSKISDFTFKISFNLNIVEENNKLNVCKISLDMPYEELITNGVSIVRLDNSKFLFTVK